MKVAEMELSKVDNKTKVETTLQEEAAIRQDNKDREMERLADAAEKAARVKTLPKALNYSTKAVEFPLLVSLQDGRVCSLEQIAAKSSYLGLRGEINSFPEDSVCCYSV